jgi:hypothetical protein
MPGTLLERVEAHQRKEHVASCPQRRSLPTVMGGGTDCLHYPYTDRESTLGRLHRERGFRARVENR